MPAGKRKITAYLPNPGRLTELLFPGTKLLLVENHSGKIGHTVVAAEREGKPVMLHTHHTNRVARLLLEQDKVPGLEGYCIVRPEVTYGRSRFDFLLQKGNTQFVLEVKSCTLFNREIAMFPDAVTERGRRHLMELAELKRQGMRAGVLFIVHWPFARYFMPEYHTDLAFSRTLFALRKEILVRAVAVTWKQDLTLGRRVRELEIPWHLIEKEAVDRGNYLLVLHLKRSANIRVGGLGRIFFHAGHYLYVGSAMNSLTQRIERHKRRRKKLFWHIDYLRDKAEFVTALPVRTSEQLECEMAAALNKISAWNVPAFGSSDCSCETHLFGMKDDPLKSQAFVSLLLWFRIDRLAPKFE